MDEIAKLIETLRRVERLYDGATTPGERVAAGFAKERLDARLKEKMEDSPIEMKFSLQNSWSRKLFTTLARKYGLEPFRYYLLGFLVSDGNDLSIFSQFSLNLAAHQG